MKLLIDAHVFLTSWRQGAAYEDISGPRGSRPMPSFLATRAANGGNGLDDVGVTKHKL
jgi:hypothetical protein